MTERTDSSFDESLRASLCLSMVSGVGPLTRTALLEHFGSAAAVLRAAPSELRRVPGVGQKVANAIASAQTDIDVTAELETCRAHGIQILDEQSADYPKLLHEIHDPPGILFVQGELTTADKLSVAIVGTRHASRYGIEQAERFAANLSRAGITIVSGLARGIDAAAHRGALEANGRTIAVLASGLCNVYPPEHQKLAEDVSRQGAVVSENPSFFKPHQSSFPRRNRIITGISVGVIVVEAPNRSGALLTANHAMEQGRDVFAVPGRVDSRMSHGCHKLIREGAKLVENADDVLEELGPLFEAAPKADGTQILHPAELQLNEQESQVLNAIQLEPTSIDQVVMETGIPVHRVLSTISVLEMRRLVKRISGNSVARVSFRT
ncbi:MAG: DNA-processing protein DprA [Pirellulaceae bacterium]